MDNIAMVKREWRSLMKARRKQLDEHSYDHFSSELNQYLIAFVEQYKPQAIKGFIPYAKEPNIWPFIQYCWQQSITYIIPKCEQDSKQMRWYAVSDKNQLVNGAYNILEPDTTLCHEILDEAELVLVPALAFTKRGERLGYGGGYYDRFYELANDAGMKWVGIAFSLFIEPTLPTERHDFTCHYIVTDEGVIDCKVEEKEDSDGFYSF